MPTIGDLFDYARAILNDRSSVAGPTRYTDDDLMMSLNQALMEARGRRPDAFLGMGLRVDLPFFQAPDDLAAPFPLDQIFYPLFVYFVVGWSELREDEFTADNKAVLLINRFSTGLVLLGGGQAVGAGG